MKRIVLFTGLLLSPCFAVAEEEAEFRLPTSIVPQSQSIGLRIDPAQPDFTGSTSIELTVEKTSERIGVYQIGVNMTSIVLSQEGVERVLQASDGEADISWLSDGNDIATGDYTLTIEFDGKFSTDALGMYRTSFEGNDYIFTQMESMYARRAFPVFDEPGFKIPYTLSISAPAGLTVVANAPVASKTEVDGWQHVEFEAMPPMPSYLLALSVGALESVPIEGMSVPGRLYAPVGHAGKAGFIVRETPKIVAALEDYFGLDYPYAKLDFLAVPEFAMGAMENPGLITYRTEILLVGDEPVGWYAQRPLMVVAHEVAHMWYGDLVTMEWWDDLWLNESFASWMAWSILEETHPRFESNLNLPQAGAFPIDQRTSSRAIRSPVRVLADMQGSGGLQYTKGHALLNMMEQYVGEDVWQRAIRKYIQTFAWGNTRERDLWDAVAAESGLDIYKIASDYLNQPGYAIVDVSSDGTVSQKRYLAEGFEADALEWHVPLNVKYKSEGNVRQTFLMLDDTSGSLDIPNNTDWIFPDAGGMGYYRWKISLEQLYELVDDADELTERERIALLGNSEALLNAGELAFVDYLFVVNALIQDAHPLVFRSALEMLKGIGDDFVTVENRDAFARFIDEALAERFQKVGVEGRADDTSATVQMRPRLIRTLGQFGNDEAVREAATRLTDAYFESEQAVEPRVALEAMRVSALNGDAARYEEYRTAYLNSDSEVQRANMLVAFYFDDPDVVKRHLDFSISSAVQAGNAAQGLRLFAYVVEDHSILYEWLDENLDAMIEKLPQGGGPAFPQLFGYTCSAANLEMLKKFFNDRGDEFSASLGRVVETAETCISRKDRYAEDLQTFLQPYEVER